MSANSSRSPGSWLRRFATLIFDADTMARVVDPTLADLQHESDDAGDDAAAGRAARLRGYIAFWKLVVLSPFVFADWPGRRQFAHSLTHIGAIVVLLVVTFGAKSEWMARWLVEIYPRVLGRFISVSDLGPYVWMLTPIAVAVLVAIGRRSPFRAAPAAIIMISGATVAAAASYGAAGFVTAFDGVGARGSTGFGPMISAFEALIVPNLLALGITGAAVMLLIVSQWRARNLVAADAGPVPSLSGAAALVLVMSMVVSLVAANRWLMINEELIDAALAMANPTRAKALGGNRVVMGMTEVAIPLMLLGVVISVTMLAAAFVAWRASRVRRPNPLMIWSTRVAVVALLVGCIWHANVISGQWQAFRTENAVSLAR
jgi:hypothetical protein